MISLSEKFKPLMEDYRSSDGKEIRWIEKGYHEFFCEKSEVIEIISGLITLKCEGKSENYHHGEKFRIEENTNYILVAITDIPFTI